MSYFSFLDLSEHCMEQTPPEAGRAAKIFGTVFIHELDIRLFGYSVSQRASERMPRENRTVESFSIADGLTEVANSCIMLLMSASQ